MMQLSYLKAKKGKVKFIAQWPIEVYGRGICEGKKDGSFFERVSW